MTESRLQNHIRRQRESAGLSQQVLAERVGVSRQAIAAIESGKQVPSTVLGLRLAGALGSRVDDLFQLSPADGLSARVVPRGAEAPASGSGSRVALGEVGGHWVAHRMPSDATLAAHGVLVSAASEQSALVRPLVDVTLLRRNVLLAGCAPLLGALAQHVANNPGDARATWLAAGSTRALELLRDGLVHIAGVHVGAVPGQEDNTSLVRRILPNTKMLLVDFTRWRLGLVLPAGNPQGIHSGADLFRPGLRLARREPGTGADKLVRSLAAAEGIDRPAFSGPLANGHMEVAQLVRCGAADVGIAIEGVALADGLGFVPLVEERFDLVVPADLAAARPVSSLIEALGDPGFRADAHELPGYDTEACGHVTTLEAA